MTNRRTLLGSLVALALGAVAGGAQAAWPPSRPESVVKAPRSLAM